MPDKPTYMKHMPHFLGPVAPITIDHAEGSWVYDTDGGKWLDFVIGIAVVNTGHCHPKVVKAVQEQAAKVAARADEHLPHGPMLELAEKLTGILPEGMDEVMFANSGAEAVENAVKLAKQATRRPGIIAFQGAFHGRTHLTMALTDSAVHYRGHHEPLVGGIYHARYCYPYRTPASEDPTAYALEDVRRVLRAEIYGDDVAAIIVEPIQGEGGFIVPTAEFMQGLRAIADEIGACLIIDEIQAGIGRTGKWFVPRALRRQAGHHHRRQGHRLRLPARRHRRRPRAVGQVSARLDGRHLRRQRRRLRRRRRHHGRHGGRGHARQRHQAGREAAQVLEGPAGAVPGHRRGARQGPHVRHRVRAAGHQGAQRGRRQGVHRRVPASTSSSSWAPAARWATACASCRRSTSATPTWTCAIGIFDEAAKVVFA